MAGQVMLITGAGMLYCGAVALCCLGGMFQTSTGFSFVRSLVDEYKDHLQNGVDLKVSVNETSDRNLARSECKATTCDSKSLSADEEKAMEEWDVIDYGKCRKTSNTKVDCWCADFSVDATTTWGPATAKCVSVEVDSTSVNSLFGKSDVDAVFVSVDGVDELFVGVNKEEAIKELDNVSAALNTASNGFLAGGIIGILCMLGLCLGGCFAIWKHTQEQKSGGGGGYAANPGPVAGPVVVGTPVASS